jgi:hypothetical protein
MEIRHMGTVITEVTANQPAVGLWLPVDGAANQFYFHTISEGSTCVCSLCEFRATTALLTKGL